MALWLGKALQQLMALRQRFALTIAKNRLGCTYQDTRWWSWCMSNDRRQICCVDPACQWWGWYHPHLYTSPVTGWCSPGDHSLTVVGRSKAMLRWSVLKTSFDLMSVCQERDRIRQCQGSFALTQVCRELDSDCFIIWLFRLKLLDHLAFQVRTIWSYGFSD